MWRIRWHFSVAFFFIVIPFFVGATFAAVYICINKKVYTFVIFLQYDLKLKRRSKYSGTLNNFGRLGFGKLLKGQRALSPGMCC